MRKRILVMVTVFGVVCGGSASASAGMGSDGIGDPAFPQDGNGGYRVSYYDVRLDYDPAKPDFLIGDTTVNAVATQDLSRFDLDLEGFEVASVTVNGVAAKAFGREGAHELVITPAKEIRRGAKLDVRVKYAGTPGLFWMTYDGGAVHAFAEPHSASSWYPVNDHPSDKATFRVSATVPDGWTVIGNGEPEPLVVRDGKKTFGWNEKRPIASYLTGLFIDKFSVYTKKLADGTAVIDAYVPGGGEASKPQEDRLPEILDFLSSKFGKYPFPTAGGVFFPGDSGGGFEVQGRSAYPGGISPAQISTIVHENAHQWFGNSVSVENWRDICLKECFATYSEWLWNEAKEGHDLDAGYRAIVTEHKGDPEFWKYPLAEPGDAFYGGAYTVGPLMLHALRRTVGDDVFFRTLKDFLRQNQYGNASWPDFEKLVAHESGRSLSAFFQAWAHSDKIPADQFLSLNS